MKVTIILVLTTVYNIAALLRQCYVLTPCYIGSLKGNIVLAFYERHSLLDVHSAITVSGWSIPELAKQVLQELGLWQLAQSYIVSHLADDHC
jgi:hypothetical protein